MDSPNDGGVNEEALDLEEQKLRNFSVIQDLNTQIVPQIQNLADGPLIEACGTALMRAVEIQQTVLATVLQVRMRHEGKLYGVIVQVHAGPV